MAINPETQSFFHGCITRIEAEDALTKAGRKDGLFLVRESANQTGSYALSMCHNNKVIHYHIQRRSDGLVNIEDGPRFPGPVELVRYHQHHLDGLLAKLSLPCTRPPGVMPRSYSGANQKHIKEAALAAIESMGLADNDTTVRSQMESFIGKVLHQNEIWFHGNISREEAQKRLQRCGCVNGLFLIRERKAPVGTFAMGLCHDRSIVHYLFDTDAQGRLSIKSGPKFDNLMLAVDHYGRTDDGLLCKLLEPCDVRNFGKSLPRGRSQDSMLPGPDLFSARPPSRSFNEADHMMSQKPDLLAGIPLPPKSASSRMSASAPPFPAFSDVPPPVPASRPISHHDRPISHHEAAGAASSTVSFEAIYDSVKMKKSSGYHNQFKSVVNQSFDLKVDSISLGKELGHGNFGSVLKGTYKMPNGEKIPVAVKSLKSDEINNPKSEIMHEARVMMKLDHPYIVRIIGMCQGPTMMLVMELAGEGPLNKYLKSHKTMPMLNILVLMLQVAEGMQYLESMQFVHRDLAARNVLVVNESFVKISDFGMSRAMGAGSDYYKAGTAGRWPLKWYAPECIYFRKFSSKSDVWSYGVTLWEATSHGARPYHGLNGQIILEKIENGYRLPAPENVPNGVYKMMRSCWEWEEDVRPSFKQVWKTLGHIIMGLKG